MKTHPKIGSEHTRLRVVNGGALIIVGMYLMTGVWRNMFAKFSGVDKIRKENDSSDNTVKDRSGETRPSDIGYGSDQGR